MQSHLLLSALFLTLVSFGQNLIWNGSFEQSPFPHDYKLKAQTDSLDNWGRFGDVALHFNNYCGGKSLSGVCYIDRRLYSSHIKNYREYAEAKLTCPLIAGSRYILKISTMPIKGRYLVGNIGAYLSNKPVDISAKRVLPFKPIVVSTKGKIVDNPYNYTLISDTITASGGEQYIIIGNFDDDGKLPKMKFFGFDTLVEKGNWGPMYSSIYVYDDIELIPLNPYECPQAGIKPMVITDTVNHVDTIFTLEDIHFATNSCEPMGKFDEMYKIVKRLLNHDTSLAVEVSGFTDITGSKAFNYELSLKRAASISKQLHQMGIPCSKIFYSGYGSESPVHDTLGESIINRRVELNIAPYSMLQGPDLKSFCNTSESVKYSVSLKSK